MVAGDLFIDMVMSGFSFWPEPGQEAVASEYCREIGGGAAITAAGLAKLGSRVGVLGVVGNDGTWLVERLRHHGVHTEGIAYDLHEPTAFTVAVSSPHDRAFFTYLGANHKFSSILMEAATERLLAHARHVHLACAPDLDTAGELLPALSQNGCLISLDVGWHEEWLRDPRSMSMLKNVDIFFPNQSEASAMTGLTEPRAMLDTFGDAGVKTVVLKLGARGAALLCDGRVIVGEPFPVEPVDTTGAGDCFDAGFLHAWLKGEEPETCLRVATICGALSTEALGGISGFPTAERLDEMMMPRHRTQR
jgi:sugar/nucleoside kinase (ribokinase family)